MALQTQPSFQNIASATAELWPSVSSLILAPWRERGLQRPSQAGSAAVDHVVPQPPAVRPRTIPYDDLPDFLQRAPLPSLSYHALGHVVECRTGLQNPLWRIPQRSILRASPLAGALPTVSRGARHHSVLSVLHMYPYSTIRPTVGLRASQQRTLFGQSSSRNLLAHMEQTANNNPQSATAQNAFYQALLRADMPNIVVERYQTGRYATNAACDAAYIRALERVGQSEKIKALDGSKPGQGQLAEPVTQAQLQAIGQAVAAQSRGANMALNVSKNGATAGGAKDSPLYVVVNESIGALIYRWSKFLVICAIVIYFSLVVVAFLIEMTGVLRRVGSTQNHQAQPQHQKVRFSDVHGCDEAKEELQELVEFLKAPEKFSNLGGKLPKGVLLVGPPGTGKTLLARAVAGEAGVPFFFMSGSEFDEVYVGVGAKRVRELFNAARARAPAIVFIDELDAIGGKRNERDAAYAKQTLNQLLTDLDGFAQNSGVIFLAATNFPEMLDKALTRPGRFDRRVVVPLPDVRGRVAILKHHMKAIQAGTDVDAAVIARGTPGFSGAELENVVNQAAVHASRNRAAKVSMKDFEWAKDKVLMGAERRSAIIQHKDKVMTAYHEGGHALVAMFTAAATPLYKATIMPRGNALGVTSFLLEMDKVSQAKKEFLAQIDVCMGGKVAEELVYGPENVTSGTSSDIQQATRLAYQMVTMMGFSDDLGNVDLNSNYNQLSSETKQRIEKEVRRIIQEGHDRAKKLLSARRQELDTLAKALVEYETLNREEIQKVLRGEKLPEKMISNPSAPIKLPETLLPAGFGSDAGSTAVAEGKSTRSSSEDGSPAVRSSDT